MQLPMQRAPFDCDIHEPTIYLRVDNIANTLRICLNWFGYVRIIQGQMIDAAVDTSVAQNGDASVHKFKSAMPIPNPFEITAC